MSKRAGEHHDDSEKSQIAKHTDDGFNPDRSIDEEQDVEMGEFEDPYGDDIESDGEIVEIDTDGEGDGQDLDQIAEDEERQQEEEEQNTLYLPHKSRPLGPDEMLEPDPTVYEMLHRMNLPWPCMTLDVLPDTLGAERRSWPHSVYLATATQAKRSKDNELIIMKLSSLAKTLVKDDQDDDDDEEEDDDVDYDPILESETIALKDTTNRLRVSPFAAETGEYLTATMSENGDVNIFDISPQFKAFDSPGYMIPKPNKRAIHTIRNHGNVEGYGLDWSPLVQTGALLSGDMSGRVYHTQRTTSKWVTEKFEYQASQASIEDIQWSRNEKTVFATGGTDGYIRIWDIRSKKHKPAINCKASTTDVNVLSWCNKIDYLIASGHDDGSWGVWDLRQFKPNSETYSPVVSFDFHKSAITSIEFNPLDESIVAVSSEDNTVTLWDLAVEADDEEIEQQRQETKELEDIPAQLMFVHWQKDVKDVRWHKQIPGTLCSVGTDGLNVWKTVSV
ncbi:unnamed protein product [Kuraishia capsulata CBS 1993]|uniref:Uncharacterized protein n=1 Tax=Kuraishia capsulata CBS 1993 TaxID=1382522 RepID=W6MQR0_9ASCO|nr:uncharacterized protein KUCA_T00004672001 [Kuraishia capsulata CBS 1993]CDK28688.1 unnamed protein product [Kuraishia capsulata CBS 1993]